VNIIYISNRKRENAMDINNGIKDNIELGTMREVDELEKLYDDLNDYFQSGFK